MKVTTHYVAFWALLILATTVTERWVAFVCLGVSLASLIAHYLKQGTTP